MGELKHFLSKLRVSYLLFIHYVILFNFFSLLYRNLCALNMGISQQQNTEKKINNNYGHLASQWKWVRNRRNDNWPYPKPGSRIARCRQISKKKHKNKTQNALIMTGLAETVVFCLCYVAETPGTAPMSGQVTKTSRHTTSTHRSSPRRPISWTEACARARGPDKFGVRRFAMKESLPNDRPPVPSSFQCCSATVSLVM